MKKAIRFLFLSCFLWAAALVISSASAQNIDINDLKVKLDGYTPPPELLAALETAASTGDSSALQAALVQALIADSANAKMILKTAMISNMNAGLEVFQNVMQEFVDSQPDNMNSVLSDIVAGAVEAGMTAAGDDSDAVASVIETVVTASSEVVANSGNLSAASLEIITSSAVTSVLARGGEQASENSFKLVELVAGSAAKGAIAGGGSEEELGKLIEATMVGIVDTIMESGASSDINIDELISSANEGVQSGIVASLGQNNQMTQTLVIAAVTSSQETVTANEFETASATEPETEVDGSESVSPN